MSTPSTPSNAVQPEFWTDPASGMHYARFSPDGRWTAIVPSGATAPPSIYPGGSNPATGSLPPGPATHPFGPPQLTGASTSDSQPPIPIDPVLLAQSSGRADQGKSSARTVDNGKKRKLLSTRAEDPKKRRGRGKGISNYSAEDVDALLDIVEEHLPVGPKGWDEVEVDFGSWAAENGRPSRAAKSLETKFKQLVKTPKPTGDAECPPHVERAHEIDSMMDEKVGTKELDDDEFADKVSDDELSDVSEDEKEKARKVSSASVKPAPPKTFVARRAGTDRPKPRNPAQELVASLSSALDPGSRASRQQDFASNSFQTTQLLSLNQQLSDLRRTVDSLRDRLEQKEQQRQDALRRAEIAELRLETQRYHGQDSQRRQGQDSHRDNRFGRQSPDSPPIRQPPFKYRVDTYFPEGGSRTDWVGGMYDDDRDHFRMPPTPEPGTRTVIRPVTPDDSPKRAVRDWSLSPSKRLRDAVTKLSPKKHLRKVLSPQRSPAHD